MWLKPEVRAALSILAVASQEVIRNQALVVHACNPSYLGVRDWEDHCSRPALGKYFKRPYL
jgi:hypothetical protein